MIKKGSACALLFALRCPRAALSQLQGASATQNLYQDDDDCDDQQHVNESADGGSGNQSQSPECEKNDSDGKEHGFGFLFNGRRQFIGAACMTDLPAKRGAGLFAAARLQQMTV